MRPSIRDATADDQAFISEMLYEALFVPPGAPTPVRSVVGEPDLVDYHADFGHRPGDVGVIAMTDDAPVGAAWVRHGAGYGRVDDETPELTIAVRGDMRGVGVGSVLLEALLARVTRCSLSCDTRNPALGLYERHGFVVVRADDDHHVVMLRSES